MRMILASAGSVPLDRLAEMADKIAKYAAIAITSVTPASASQLTGVEEHLHILTDAVNAFQPPHRGRQ